MCWHSTSGKLRKIAACARRQSARWSLPCHLTAIPTCMMAISSSGTTARRSAIVARIALNDVMVDRRRRVKGESLDIIVRTIFELGPRARQSALACDRQERPVFVPLTIGPQVMVSVMKTHAFNHITYEFVPGVEVIP